MPAGKRVLCVGALTLDLVFRMERLPSGAGKFLPIEMIQVAAGMASSAAVAASRLGGDVALWASRGDDAAGETLIAAMQAEGVDCTLVRRVAGAPSATSMVLVDPWGERMVVPYYAPALLRDPVLPAGVAEGAFPVVLADVRWPAAGMLALAAARQAGAQGVLDADLAARETLEGLAPLASHIVASRVGATLLVGEAEPARSAAALAARFGAEIVVTDGENGCWWVAHGGTPRHVPAPRVEAVDTNAAGDVFHGAYALGLAEGQSGEALLRFASAAAALKCTRPGGPLGAPGRSEVDAFVKAAY